MIIDYTYFRGEITIAQKSQLEVREDLQLLINKYEPVYLKQLMGFALYTAFIAGIDPISGAEQRWIDLLEGVVYEANGRDYEWMGFENNLKESVIANFVYSKYIQKEIEQTTGIGQVRPTAENAVIVSALPKIVRAWNEMVNWQKAFIHYLDQNKSVYPEWKPYSQNRWFYFGLSPDYEFCGNYEECDYWPEIFHRKNNLGI